VEPSDELAPQQAELERLLFERVYRHPSLLEKRSAAGNALGAMFDALMGDPQRLPPRYGVIADRDGHPRAVADYLAGMTDRFAWEEYDRPAAKGR
jgi:dGTPase